MDTPSPIFCRRCSAQLVPGRGDFYVVRVEAFADPSPPDLSPCALEKDQGQIVRDLLAQMEKFSERELLEMVHRRMSFHLCAKCYHRWIEDPTG